MSYPFPEHDLEMAQAAGFPRSLPLRLRGTLGGLVLYRVILRYADHVFVQSEQMKQDVGTHGIPSEKITPVPMGVTEKAFHPAASGIDEIKVVPNRIVYLGTLAAVRRMETIIQAMPALLREVPSAHLYMIGDGNYPSERAFLEAEAKRLGVGEQVTFTGFLPLEEAWKIVLTAQVCLSPIYPTPTLKVGSPTKLVEYLALGKPVVANDHPEQSRIIAETRAGICVPWSSDAFASAIAEVLRHPDKFATMAASGRDWVRVNRTYGRIADSVYQIYQELLHRA
jgi:glycosyltransferase involved in cell wall biosynthesis